MNIGGGKRFIKKEAGTVFVVIVRWGVIGIQNTGPIGIGREFKRMRIDPRFLARKNGEL